MADSESASLFLSPEQVAIHLHCSPAKVRSMLRAGELPGRKVEGKWSVGLSELERWSKEQDERSNIEEKLRRSEELFRASFECSEIGKALVTREGRWIRVNSALCKMVGYSESELLDLSFEGVTHPNDYATDWEQAKLLADGKINSYHREKRYIHKNGQIIWVSIQVAAVHDAVGRTVHLVSEIQDITDRKRGEEKQKKLFEHLQIATSTARLGIWSRDMKTGHLERNKVLADIYGRRLDEFVTGDDWRQQLHPDDKDEAIENIHNLYKGQPFQDTHFRIIRPDGTIRYINSSASPVYDENDEIVTVVGINIDVTERIRAQEDLRLAHEELEAKVARRTKALTEATEEAQRANLAKSEFLSRTSHELRTPLNAILGFAQILEIDNLRPDQRQSVEFIMRGGRHLLDLIDELLSLSRLNRGQDEVAVEPISLDELMDEVLSLIHPIAERNDIRMLTDKHSWGGLYVLADGQKLRQVLLNLLSNAIKYNRTGGKVMLSCDVITEEVGLGTNGTKTHLPSGIRIVVADTGIGIAPHQKKQLYMPFNRLGAERTKIEGTGLGLTISKALVEAMKGTLSLKSEAGRGSEFSIQLPLAPSPPKGKGKIDEFALLTAGNGKPRTILYIEDNLSNFALIQMLLHTDENTTLLSAMQGSIGLDLATQHHPDLILLDLHLPDIMGDEVMRRLRLNAGTKDIPVIILSADATPSQIKRLQDEGAVAYLTKPLDVRKFLRAVEETLRDKSGVSLS